MAGHTDPHLDLNICMGLGLFCATLIPFTIQNAPAGSAGLAGSLIMCVFTSAGSAGHAIICVFTAAGPHPVWSYKII